MVAQIASSCSSQINVFELLQYVVEELDIYSNHLTMNTEDFSKKYGSRSIISHNNTWRIENPANPEDNLANAWNEDERIPQKFFKWLKACKIDLLQSLNLPDQQFRASIENAFGTNIVQRQLGTKYNSIPPKPINSSTVAKPYGV